MISLTRPVWKSDVQLSDSFKVDGTPLPPQCLDIIEEVDVPSFQHDLAFRHRGDRSDSLEVWKDGGLLDVY